jgi:hypothetical protein
MEHVDHVAARVSLATLVAFFSGATLATLKGLPRRATALKVAGSFALVGTSVFSSERLAYAVMESQIDQEQERVLISHAFSGVAGGGLNGYLYQKRPLRGMFFFVPTMMAIGFAELKWKSMKQNRREELLQIAEDETPTPSDKE